MSPIALPAPVSFFLFFGAVFILNMALGQLWVRPFNTFHRTTAGLLAVTGGFQLLYASYASGLTHEFPHLAMLHVPLLLAEGPLLFFYFHHLIEDEPYNGRRFWHVLAPFASIVLLAPFFSLDGSTKLIFLRGSVPVGDFMTRTAFALARYMLPAAFLSVLFYLAFLLRKYSYLLRKSSRRESPLLRMSLYLILAVAVCGVAGFIGQILDPRVKTLGSMAASTAFLIIYHANHRHSRLLASLRLEFKSARYAISHLGNLDVSTSLRELREHMASEHPYLDEDCTLESLSADLDLKPAQLTELLNVHVGEGFYEFLNRHRITAAEHMLLDKPHESVLSIGYACGFNSKSSFYSSFKKLKGASPARYRKLMEDRA